MSHGETANRPTGVTFLAVLYLASTLVPVFLIGLVILLSPGMFAGFGLESPQIRFMHWTIRLGDYLGFASLLLPLGLALLYVSVGFGLWRLRNWARVVALVLAAGQLALVVGDFLYGVYIHFWVSSPQEALFFGFDILQTLGVAISIWALWYLFRPNVRQAFAAK